MVGSVAVQVSAAVKKGQKRLTVEAMKMETPINTEVSGVVAEILVKTGSQVEAGDLLVRIE